MVFGKVNETLVSVIMPVYKSRPDYLKASLSSILSQTYDNLEVIIVIDTTDKKRDAEIFDTIEAFKDDHRIQTIVRVANKGYCSALNTAILRSSGTFIARLDSDDYWESSKIEKQMNLIRTSKIVLAGTWTSVVDEEGKKRGEIRTPVSTKSIRDLIMLHNPFVHSSIIFARHVMNEVGFYNESFDGAEDYEFYLRVISRGYSCVNIPLFLTYLRESRNSIMRGNKWRNTRKSYFMAKCEAVTKLGYSKGSDMLFTLTSLGSILVTPRMGTHLKKAIGWYHPALSSRGGS